MGIVYRYTKANTAEAVTHCELCGHSLTDPETVDVDCVAAGQVFRVFSRLDEYGRLVDREDVIANGYHSLTLCGGCGEPLLETCDEHRTEE